MKVYAKPGTNIQSVDYRINAEMDTLPGHELYVEMEGERPDVNYIATDDGKWVVDPNYVPFI